MLYNQRFYLNNLNQDNINFSNHHFWMISGLQELSESD
uniref:Uncharacterized protein n=1 Tax=Tetranychus urticae TaxID=32264 RepID=T1KE53_TETUR